MYNTRSSSVATNLNSRGRQKCDCGSSSCPDIMMRPNWMLVGNNFQWRRLRQCGSGVSVSGFLRNGGRQHVADFAGAFFLLLSLHKEGKENLYNTRSSSAATNVDSRGRRYVLVEKLLCMSFGGTSHLVAIVIEGPLHIHDRYALHNFSCVFSLQKQADCTTPLLLSEQINIVTLPVTNAALHGCPFRHFLQSSWRKQWMWFSGIGNQEPLPPFDATSDEQD